jgi:hypothetical protein
MYSSAKSTLACEIASRASPELTTFRPLAHVPGYLRLSRKMFEGERLAGIVESTTEGLWGIRG